MSDAPIVDDPAAALVQVEHALVDLVAAHADEPVAFDALGSLRRLALELVDRVDRAVMLAALDALADDGDGDDGFERFMAGDEGGRAFVEFA
jgi:hypothetical protein